MLAELQKLTTEAELAAWALDGLPRKNQLMEADARTIEIATSEGCAGARTTAGRQTAPRATSSCQNASPTTPAVP